MLTRPGFPKALARTLTELRLAGASTQHLSDLPRSGPSPRDRLRCGDRKVQTPLGRIRETAHDTFFTRAGETLPGPFRGVIQNENRPSQYDPNGPPSPQFRIVHAVRISNDGLVYVCDRTNDRLQVFRKDGTFVREVVIA